MAITRINDFQAAAGREQALRAFLRSVIAMIGAAPGCQEVELLVDPGSPGHLVIVERWDSVAAHQTAAKRVPPKKIAEISALLAGPPTERYYDHV